MHIAFLAGLQRSITMRTTASRNRIMIDLALGLLQKGHTVTIFGTGDSSLPGVEFIEVAPKGLKFISKTENPFYTETAYIVHATRQLVQMQERFDVIHNHMYPEFLPLLADGQFTRPVVTTVHAQITPELRLALADTEGKTTLVCISHNAQQRLELPAEVVYNGTDPQFFTFDENKSRDYLLFVGRIGSAKNDKGEFIDPKGVTKAIAAAEILKKPLKIVGSVEDHTFYTTLLEQHLSEQIQLVGPVSSEQTQTREAVRDLYQGASALINPIQWEEPFGLVMVEAMTCGTPVIAFNRGSVPEIVKDGVTGFIVDPDDTDRPGKGSWIIKKQGIEGLVEAIARIPSIDRKACREHVQQHFTIQHMIDGYEKIYEAMLHK